MPPSRLERLKGLLDWKVIVFTLVGAGMALNECRTSVPTRAEFEAARSAGAAEHQTLRTEAQAIRERVLKSETDIGWIREQLTEIARAVGARQVPTP